MEYYNEEDMYKKTLVELYNEWVKEKKRDSFQEMVLRFNKVDKVYFYSGNMVLPALKYMIRKGKLTYSYQNYYMLRAFFKKEKGKVGIKWFLKKYGGKAEYNEKETINQFTEFDFVLDFYKCTDIHLKNYDIFFNHFILKSNFLVHPYQDFKQFLQVIIRKRDKIMLNKYFKFIEQNKEKVFDIGNKVKIDKCLDGYLWLWFKMRGDEKKDEWLEKHNPLFFRTFFRETSELTNSRENIWEYFIMFLKKKGFLPNPSSADLCKTVYMNEELFVIFTKAFKEFSSPELINNILLDVIKPDFNSYLIQGILNNWKVNIPFLERLCFKLIKSTHYLRHKSDEIKNINSLIKKGVNIRAIEKRMAHKYIFHYEENNKANKYLLKKAKCLPFPIIERINELKPILIKWIKQK